MIASISGRLALKTPVAIVVYTPGGVAYDIIIPVSVYDGLPAVGNDVTLCTRLIVREDAHMLYGFKNPNERLVFDALVLHVTGVGPKKAIGILSSVPADQLIELVLAENQNSLQKLPGVGPKLAERMILDLRGKIEAAPKENTSNAPVKRAHPQAADAQAALVTLGFKVRDAQKAVEAAAASVSADAPVGELIKAALKKGES